MLWRSLLLGFTPATATNYLKCLSSSSRRFVFKVLIDHIAISPSHRPTSRNSWKYFIRTSSLPYESVRFRRISSHNHHTFINMFILRWLVSAPSLGHHQAVIIQESEYVQKLGTIKQVVPLLHRGLLKSICQESKARKQYRKKSPKDVLK